MSFPVFRHVADHAILVEFGDTFDNTVHNAVLRLDRALAAAPFAGLIEAVPAFVNLLVDFNPVVTDHPTAERHLRQLLSTAPPYRHKTTIREVLVCYDDDFSTDLEAVAHQSGLDRESVIKAHLSGSYDVIMYGFAPGYAYLAGVPGSLHLSRKTKPVHNIAAGSVLIAGAQCLVTTMIMPTGWWIIGRSPTRILTKDDTHPFLFDVGDSVVFRRISRAEYEVAR